ncbi:hypothetical protein [Streptomyces xinghaiensis]|uniref:hypothetical protein n=1 Tax=Streptomyces xinghaiensis TaxID=1038928 RepID=UPI000BAFC9B2|nr:hypothetical protein [Streptomyces xinghaiensis]MZE76736.1 hypothetical protein [Streptomyces sp. SID5475]
MIRGVGGSALRPGAFLALLTVVFWAVTAQTAAAADGGEDGSGSGGLLAPLDVSTVEGVPLSGYELGADGGTALSFSTQVRAFLLGGAFTVVRLLVGLACWLIDFTFSFPLFPLLLGPAQTAADSYNQHVVGALGLKGLMLSWAFVFGLILLMRGKVGQGLGELVLTLLISALAASAFVRPDYLLGQDGPISQTHRAALEVAQITVDSHDFAGSAAACSPGRGRDGDGCADTDGSSSTVSKPVQDALTNALVVKPYQLLQYGQTLNSEGQADRAAYEAHLKWVKGQYALEPAPGAEDRCEEMVSGPAGDFCGSGADPLDDGLGGGFRSPEQQQFDRFVTDLEKAGKTGKAAAAYAADPTWDRVGGAVLLLIAVVLVAAIVGAMALVLLGTQAADLVAAACSGLAFVWAMLPGPSRQVLWRWVGIFMVSVLVMFATAMFLPLLGIAVDAILTDGPDLMVERLLLIDALAVMGLAFHRRLLVGLSAFGNRMAVRMRYAKVGGTHLPGDTSELGAALALHGGRGALGNYASDGLLGGGLTPGRGRPAVLGLQQRLLGRIGSLADTVGAPVPADRMLGDAAAEARRGLAPAGLVKDGVHGALLGAHALLIGWHPGDEKLATWRRPTVEDAEARRLREGGGAGPGGEGPALRGLGGNAGRDDGKVVDKTSGEVLYDPESGRDLLSTRLHNRLVRLRGYRLAHRSGRLAYGATYGLPAIAAAGRRSASRLTEDVRTQLRVTRNTLREDGRQWQPAAEAARHPVQRAAVAARVHGPTAARTVRDTAAGVVLGASPSEPSGSPARSGRPRPGVSATAEVEAQREARRRVLDALMQAQRATWEQQPRWGGRDGEDR